MATATVHPNHQLISSEDVEGTNVYDMKGKNIGDIDHLMIDKILGRDLRRDELWRVPWPWPQPLPGSLGRPEIRYQARRLRYGSHRATAEGSAVIQ